MMGELLKEKQFTKFLCILTDNKFIWSQQINYIKLKISKGMSILTQLRRIISKETLTMLFLNLYNLTLTSLLVWGGATNINLKPIQSKLKETIRKTSFKKTGTQQNHCSDNIHF